MDVTYGEIHFSYGNINTYLATKLNFILQKLCVIMFNCCLFEVIEGKATSQAAALLNDRNHYEWIYIKEVTCFWQYYFQAALGVQQMKAWHI